MITGIAASKCVPARYEVSYRTAKNNPNFEAAPASRAPLRLLMKVLDVRIVGIKATPKRTSHREAARRLLGWDDAEKLRATSALAGH